MNYNFKFLMFASLLISGLHINATPPSSKSDETAETKNVKHNKINNILTVTQIVSGIALWITALKMKESQESPDPIAVLVSLGVSKLASAAVICFKNMKSFSSDFSKIEMFCGILSLLSPIKYRDLRNAICSKSEISALMGISIASSLLSSHILGKM